MKLQKLMCEYLRCQVQGVRTTRIPSDVHDTHTLQGVAMMAIPAGGDLLWQWFVDLNSKRTYHQAGPNPISDSEILSYRQVMRWPIEPRHAVILRAMDGVWLELANRKPNDAPAGATKLPPISGHAMTAGMFDAIFG